MTAQSKRQFLEWPLEPGYKNKSIPIDSHVKMNNFSTEKKHIHSLVQWTVLVSKANFTSSGKCTVFFIYITC